MKKIKHFVLSIINPVEEALKNLHASNSTAANKNIQFKRLYPNCGLGLILTIISDNPGLHRNEILAKCNSSGQKSDMFVIMNNAKLVEYNKGYYLTNLGKNFLKYFQFKWKKDKSCNTCQFKCKTECGIYHLNFKFIDKNAYCSFWKIRK